MAKKTFSLRIFSDRVGNFSVPLCAAGGFPALQNPWLVGCLRRATYLLSRAHPPSPSEGPLPIAKDEHTEA